MVRSLQDRRARRRRFAVIVLACVTVFGGLGVAGLLPLPAGQPTNEKRIAAILEAADLDRIALSRCGVPGDRETMLCGRFEVFENRVDRVGRKIHLSLAILPARGESSRPDPIFYLMGGPGGAATLAVGGYRNSWMREERDLVFVDQRGTGGSNPLDCARRGSSGLQALFDRPFESPEVFHRCRERLERVADLRYYTTPLAADDLNDVREALGYARINLVGGSYGSRAALVFIRRHGASVRAAALSGVAPITQINPLYHAAEAQTALDRTFAECAADAACDRAFPGLAAKFDALLERLEEEPAQLEVVNPATGRPEPLRLSRAGFAEALRVFMYRMPRARRVPSMIYQAWQGDFAPLVRAIIDSNGLGVQLQMGTLLAVTCSEDVPRIDPERIGELTANTFLGDQRVSGQMAACEGWPRGWVSDDYGDPVVSDAPTLLLSGSLDPVTGPRWGERAASHLSASLHVVVPGAHGVGGRCVTEITRQFLRSASVDGVDTTCVERMRLPPFALH